MSFFEVGDKFGVSQANLMKKLGFGDTSPGGNGEVRLFKDDADYILKVWNGGSWDSIGQVDILKKDGVARVTATTSGADVNGNLIVSGSLAVNGEWHLPEATPGSQEFTSSGTFTVPSNVKFVQVTLVAGGGGGGCGGDLRGGGGGGAGAWVYKEILPVKEGASISVTIGAGGNGTNGWMQKGGDGQDSSFGDLLMKGGTGGIYATTAQAYGGAAGVGGSAIRGRIGSNGGNGAYGTHPGGSGGKNVYTGYVGGTGGVNYGTSAGGGGGAAGYNGVGGNGGNGGGAGTTPLTGVYGAGGGGGGSNNPNSGAGAPGYCKVEWGF